MTAKGKNGSHGKESSRQLAATVDPSGKIRLANKEKGFQMKIEKIQVALVQRDIRYNKSVARGLKELVNARKMETLLEEHKVKPLSDYSHLKEIYNSDLQPIKLEDLLREAEAKATTFLTGGNKVTAAQEKVVREYYGLEAKANQQGIEHIREFLIIKNQIKETPGDRKRLSQKEELVHQEQEAA